MRKRKRYGRQRQTDLWSNLGPGDPGYRLRPGASGLDPMETYTEGGRVFGLLIKGAVTGRLGPFPLMSLLVLCGLAIILVPSLPEFFGFAVFEFVSLTSLFAMAGLVFLLLVAWYVFRTAGHRRPRGDRP